MSLFFALPLPQVSFAIVAKRTLRGLYVPHRGFLPRLAVSHFTAQGWDDLALLGGWDGQPCGRRRVAVVCRDNGPRSPSLRSAAISASRAAFLAAFSAAAWAAFRAASAWAFAISVQRSSISS